MLFTPFPPPRGFTGLWGGVLCTESDGDVEPVDLRPPLFIPPPDFNGSRFLRLWNGGLDGRPPGVFKEDIVLLLFGS